MSTPNNPYHARTFGTLTLYEQDDKGMTLRDYFAGQALMGITVSEFFRSGDEIENAARAYRIADAMLKERSKETGE